jgi:hypothetical protein
MLVNELVGEFVRRILLELLWWCGHILLLLKMTLPFQY